MNHQTGIHDGKKIFFLVLITPFLSACGSFMCDYTGSAKGGLRSKHSYKSYIKKRINPTDVKIDTTVVYKDINYKYEEEKRQFRSITSGQAEVNSYDLYYRFHKNGTFYRFAKNGQSKTLNSKSFNPKKGNFGFVISRKDNAYFMSYSTINCGAFSKNEFEVDGDTLKISAGSNKGYRIWYYYIKQKVPKEWLDFKPDI